MRMHLWSFWLSACMSLSLAAGEAAADADPVSLPVEEQRVRNLEEQLRAIDDMAEREARMKAHFAALENPADKIAALGMVCGRYVYMVEQQARGALAAPLMGDPDRAVRIAAVEAVAYNEAGAAHVDVLRRLLASDDVEIRCAALWAMGRSQDVGFLSDITACQVDATADVRIAASDSLRFMHSVLPGPIDLAPLLERGLDDPDPRVRWRLLQNLSPESPTNLARLHAALRDADPAVRKTAVRTLCREGKRSDDAALALATDPEADVRYEVARGLAGDGSPAAIAALRRLLTDADPSVSMAAADSVRALVAEGRVPAGTLPDVSHDAPKP